MAATEQVKYTSSPSFSSSGLRDRPSEAFTVGGSGGRGEGGEGLRETDEKLTGEGRALRRMGRSQTKRTLAWKRSRRIRNGVKEDRRR